MRSGTRKSLHVHLQLWWLQITWLPYFPEEALWFAVCIQLYPLAWYQLKIWQYMYIGQELFQLEQAFWRRQNLNFGLTGGLAFLKTVHKKKLPFSSHAMEEKTSITTHSWMYLVALHLSSHHPLSKSETEVPQWRCTCRSMNAEASNGTKQKRHGSFVFQQKHALTSSLLCMAIDVLSGI